MINSENGLRHHPNSICSEHRDMFHANSFFNRDKALHVLCSEVEVSIARDCNLNVTDWRCENNTPQNDFQRLRTHFHHRTWWLKNVTRRNLFSLKRSCRSHSGLHQLFARCRRTAQPTRQTSSSTRVTARLSSLEAGQAQTRNPATVVCLTMFLLNSLHNTRITSNCRKGIGISMRGMNGSKMAHQSN